MTVDPRRYEFLGTLPAHLVGPTATHVHGDLVPRGRAVTTLRSELLRGRVPPSDALAWPAPALREPLLSGLRASGVAEYCRDDARLADEVVSFVLDAVHESHRLEERAIVALTAQSCGGEGRCARHGRHDCDGAGPGDPTERLDEARAFARELSIELVRKKIATSWDERVAVWKEIADLLASLAAAARLPPGTERGILRALPLHDVRRLRELLASLRALGELIRRLGRSRDTLEADGTGIADAVVRPRPGRTPRVVARDEGPGVEIRGIERGNDPSRMLPTEAALLRHPTLRRLWHARRHERALLSYHAAGALSERIRDTQSLEDVEEATARPVERGPVVLLVDTSGSMMGSREVVAKAVALQVVGVCFMERRRCYAYSFSGPDQVLAEELGLDAEGLARLLLFLERSFHGGTEPDDALRRAVARLASAAWHAADLVVLSDGLFTVAPSTRAEVAALQRARELRVHGVTVAEPHGFRALGVDELHDVTDWLHELECPRARDDAQR